MGGDGLPGTVDGAREVLSGAEFFRPLSDLPEETDARRAYLIQRESPALPVRDECSDPLSEPRTEQGGRESRPLRCDATALLLA